MLAALYTPHTLIHSLRSRVRVPPARSDCCYIGEIEHEQITNVNKRSKNILKR